MTAESKIMFQTSGAGRRRTLDPNADEGWRLLSWVSLALAIAGLSDWVLTWIPLRLGSPEWEFGTVVSTFAGLPLTTMGLAGLLASASARGIRWQVLALGWFLLLWTTLILGAFVIFLLDVPVALAAAQGPIRMGVLKAIVKTALLAVLFSATYLILGVSALRRAAKSGAQDAK